MSPLLLAARISPDTKRGNHEPPQNSTIMITTIPIVITITTTTITTINTVACIFMSLPLLRSLESGNRTFYLTMALTGVLVIAYFFSK